MYRIHISVLKATKKTPLDKIRKKKTPLDMIRNGSRLNSRSGSIDISMESYIYIHGLISWRKNDSYKTFGLVAVLRLCDLLVFSSGWYIYEIAMNRIALFR